VTGCVSPEESDFDDQGEEEETGEASQEITGFFGTGSTSGSSISGSSCNGPIINNPSWSGGYLYVPIPGSCMSNQAKLMMQVPNTTTTYGPYSMTLNNAGTQLLTPFLGPSIMPAGSCRNIQVMNPDGKLSNVYFFCR